jgi:hypothetical protein
VRIQALSDLPTALFVEAGQAARAGAREAPAPSSAERCCSAGQLVLQREGGSWRIRQYHVSRIAADH